MTQHEAITLLTSGVIDSSQLSQKDKYLLDELAQDVHLWPLLLCLIRGQLFHNVKQCHFSYQTAIQNIHVKLCNKGLTAFDKNSIEATSKSRKLAVKACIEISLELLSKPISDKLKTLILWTGIGTSLQKAVLSNLWNISEQETKDTADVLWSYGLIRFTDITISPNNITQHCVEVHAVISQYIIECMDSNEARIVAPNSKKLNTAVSVSKGLILIFLQSYGVHDPSSLTVVDYLKYKLSELENSLLPFHLKTINMHTVTDPHNIILTLQTIKDVLKRSPYTISLLSLLEGEINSIINDCKQILKNVHILCRKLNQSVQRYLYEKMYDRLIQTVEEFIKNHPICNAAQNSVTVVKKIIPYCDDTILHYMMKNCEYLMMMTSDYHRITTLILPGIKLYVKRHEQITSSLLNGTPDIEQTYHFFISGKHCEEEELVKYNSLIKLQEIAPNFVHQRVSQC